MEMSANIPREQGTIEIPVDAENGPALAYGMLLGDLDGLRYVDEQAPITGSFRIESLPEGEDVPVKIRLQWVGVDIPVRYSGHEEYGIVEFTSEDAILSLLAAGKIEAARWFALNFYPLYPAWFFRSHEGILTDGREAGQEPMSSVEYYRQFLTEEAIAEFGFPV